MKQLIRLPLFFACLIAGSLMIFACGTSSTISEDEPQLMPITEAYGITSERGTEQNLADFLRRQSGITILGSGNDVRVRIRGISTLRGADDPLFVIDGQIAGTSYRDINGRVSPRQISHIRVLKGPDAATYGVRGGNGVIQIFTKK
ncbi:MAG: TonB-dependent receptor plug domain-containing protein [Balneolaceae bacterium]|nr:TonB-dependent receptor plug domain-containing protein [Balneolaceae bacterium]MCH8548553.1 TonB-dependent receptor plug domain-containing protein [Balneolaceae bacterium]